MSKIRLKEAEDELQRGIQIFSLLTREVDMNYLIEHFDSGAYLAHAWS